MGKYIALLRGVNVGGKNSLSMAALRSAFEAGGFSEVSSYINSGNILFSSDETDAQALQHRCVQLITDTFHLDIAVAVIGADALKDALNHAPEWWDADGASKHNAIFVIAPAAAEAVVREVGETEPELEHVAHHGQVIFWSAPIQAFSRTRWGKVSSMAVYGHITVRNANTAKKLLLLSNTNFNH